MGCCPPTCGSSAPRGPSSTTRLSRARQGRAQGAFARRLLRARHRRAVPRAAPLRRARHQGSGRVRAARRDDRRSVRRRRDLPFDRAVAVQADDRRAGRRGPGLPDGPHGARKAARHATSNSSREINDAVAARFPRGPHVPHRPLSRQGNRPEPARAAVRQLAVRATVERAHIDHVQITVAETVGVEGRGDYYDSRARSATWSRTICCSCSRWSRWSRRPISTRPRCATRK